MYVAGETVQKILTPQAIYNGFYRFCYSGVKIGLFLDSAALETIPLQSIHLYLLSSDVVINYKVPRLFFAGWMHW